jgi:hypothetical protein
MTRLVALVLIALSLTGCVGWSRCMGTWRPSPLDPWTWAASVPAGVCAVIKEPFDTKGTSK